MDSSTLSFYSKAVCRLNTLRTKEALNVFIKLMESQLAGADSVCVCKKIDIVLLIAYAVDRQELLEPAPAYNDSLYISL